MEFGDETNIVYRVSCDYSVIYTSLPYNINKYTIRHVGAQVLRKYIRSKSRDEKGIGLFHGHMTTTFCHLIRASPTKFELNKTAVCMECFGSYHFSKVIQLCSLEYRVNYIGDK